MSSSTGFTSSILYKVYVCAVETPDASSDSENARYHTFIIHGSADLDVDGHDDLSIKTVFPGHIQLDSNPSNFTHNNQKGILKYDAMIGEEDNPSLLQNLADSISSQLEANQDFFEDGDIRGLVEHIEGIIQTNLMKFASTLEDMAKNESREERDHAFAKIATALGGADKVSVIVNAPYTITFEVEARRIDRSTAWSNKITATYGQCALYYRD